MRSSKNKTKTKKSDQAKALSKKDDLTQDIEKLIALAKKKGFLTYDEVNEALSEFEMEGEEFSTTSLVTSYFPVADHSLIRSAIKKYIKARTVVTGALDSPNRDEIMKAINDIRWANKMFLKKATEVCYKNLDELEPIDLNENLAGRLHS